MRFSRLIRMPFLCKHTDFLTREALSIQAQDDTTVRQTFAAFHDLEGFLFALCSTRIKNMWNNGLIKGLADQLEIYKVPLAGGILVEGFKDVPQDFWRK